MQNIALLDMAPSNLVRSIGLFLCDDKLARIACRNSRIHLYCCQGKIVFLQINESYQIKYSYFKWNFNVNQDLNDISYFSFIGKHKYTLLAGSLSELSVATLMWLPPMPIVETLTKLFRFACCCPSFFEY